LVALIVNELNFYYVPKAKHIKSRKCPSNNVISFRMFSSLTCMRGSSVADCLQEIHTEQLKPERCKG
jgi:hypothetical protein